MENELKQHVARLRNEAATIATAAQENPAFVQAKKALQEKWTKEGAPGLAAIIELRREFGSFLEDLVTLPWDTLVKGCGTEGNLARLNEAEALAPELLKQLGYLIVQGQGIPDRIKTLAPKGENPKKVAEDMFSPGTAADLRNQILRLRGIVEKIETKTGLPTAQTSAAPKTSTKAPAQALTE